MVAVSRDGIDPVQVREPWGTEDWLVSALDAGQTSTMSGDDRLDGRSGNDMLLGGAGADTLIGGLGKDDLYGGHDGDIDTFVFNDIAESGFRKKADVIHDFEVGVDKIDLSGIDAHLGMDGDQAFRFGGPSAEPNSVWISNGRSETLVRIDVTGDQRPDMETRLIGDVPLAKTISSSKYTDKSSSAQENNK